MFGPILDKLSTSLDKLWKSNYLSPIRPPAPAAIPIWAKTGWDGINIPMVVATPDETPIMPKALPNLAVFCPERPAKAPTQHKDDER